MSAHTAELPGTPISREEECPGGEEGARLTRGAPCVQLRACGRSGKRTGGERAAAPPQGSAASPAIVSAPEPVWPGVSD